MNTGYHGAKVVSVCCCSVQQRQNWKTQRPRYHTKPMELTKDNADMIETGAVSGASLLWCDSQKIQLKHRATLKWNDGSPSKVLIVKKRNDENATKKLVEISEWLSTQGLHVYVEKVVQQQNLSLTQCSVFDPVNPPHDIDLAITLGGDGTVLHLASLFIEDSPMPPTISFAMGSLGFLTPFSSENSEEVLSKLLHSGESSSQIYVTLHSRKQCEVWHDGRLTHVHRVLNECAVDRGSLPQVLMLDAFVDCAHLTTIHTDALIIATATGSTAYSMAAGGPMVAPSVPCTLLTPVAPHSISFRPIVLPETAVIEIHLPPEARSKSARVAFDGRNTVRLKSDGSIIARPCEYALPMINMHPLDEDWYEGIVQKLHWTGSLIPPT